MTEILRLASAVVATLTAATILRYRYLWERWFQIIAIGSFATLAAWRWAVVAFDRLPAWLQVVTIRGDVSNGLLILMLCVVGVMVYSDHQQNKQP